MTQATMIFIKGKHTPYTSLVHTDIQTTLRFRDLKINFSDAQLKTTSVVFAYLARAGLFCFARLLKNATDFAIISQVTESPCNKSLFIFFYRNKSVSVPEKFGLYSELESVQLTEHGSM